MNVAKLTILDFGIDSGEQFVTVETLPLIGDSREAMTSTMKKGYSVTVDAPLVASGPTGPTQRWWGIYDTKRKLWSRNADGEIFHYPVPGLAQAHLDNVIADMDHQVDGRGHSLTAQLVIKEMIAADNEGVQDVV